MEPDALGQTWQAQEIPPVVTVDAELLLAIVKRNHREFRAMILRRDALEIGVAIPLLILFTLLGLRLSWAWFVLAAACLFIVVFMLVDRGRQRLRRPSGAESIAEWLERSQSDVEHQIWLLKNVFWWYLLPPSIGIVVASADLVWQVRGTGLGFHVAVVIATGMFALCTLVYWKIYLLNQRAVRKELLPRLEELRGLSESLTHDQD